MMHRKMYAKFGTSCLHNTYLHRFYSTFCGNAPCGEGSQGLKSAERKLHQKNPKIGDFLVGITVF